MRLRRENLRTGSLLTCYDSEKRQDNRSLLFLVEGAMDVEPLDRTESACRSLVEKRHDGQRFEWHAVADQGALSAIDPFLNPSSVFRLEAAELSGLDGPDLERVFAPVIESLVTGAPELFPVAGGAVGSPAEGIQLLGRSELVAGLEARLKAGEDLYLSAPRRSGKTSVLIRLEQAATSLRAVFLDLQGVREGRHLVARLKARISGESPRAALDALGESWPKELESSLTQLTAGSSKPLVLILDELVFFLEGLRTSDRPRWAAQAHEVLSALSSAIEASGCRLVVSGSADLFDFLREELGTRPEDLPNPFRRLQPMRLPPLTTDPIELRRLLLGAGLVLTDEELRWLGQELDLSLPYPALLFLDHLATKARSTPLSRSGADLDRWLEAFLGQTSAFHDFQERLNGRAAKSAGLREKVTALLDRLAQSQVPSHELEAALSGPSDLLWFHETYPVLIEDGSVSLVSKLFRRWWRLAGG